jgi:hypothetical protein
MRGVADVQGLRGQAGRDRDVKVAQPGPAARDRGERGAEQSIRMCKLRIKISGCLRSMAGAQEPCAIRSYLATAARHGIGTLEALTRAFQGNPWIPETG